MMRNITRKQTQLHKNTNHEITSVEQSCHR